MARNSRDQCSLYSVRCSGNLGRYIRHVVHRKCRLFALQVANAIARDTEDRRGETQRLKEESLHCPVCVVCVSCTRWNPTDRRVCTHVKSFSAACRVSNRGLARKISRHESEKLNIHGVTLPACPDLKADLFSHSQIYTFLAFVLKIHCSSPLRILDTYTWRVFQISPGWAAKVVDHLRNRYQNTRRVNARGFCYSKDRGTCRNLDVNTCIRFDIVSLREGETYCY